MASMPTTSASDSGILTRESDVRVSSSRAISNTNNSAPVDDDDSEEMLLDEEPQPHEIATDPSLRCRYPSKHCLRQRTTKKTGALHSMCAFHRAKANRNQRRLEKRKRFLKDEQRLQRQMDQQQQLLRLVHPDHSDMMAPTTFMLPPIVSPENDLSSSYCYEMQWAPSHMAAAHHSPREVEMLGAHFEPFRNPVPLFKEDLEELSALVDITVVDVQ
uniref:Uncharacterized protein n=1 Tax=Globisporangium ultimum (strain ATCC 200006 / CBS 805.95 / DAOM BR144) TaxID=431595 RepID=K3XB48_GLOUD